ncbi:MAG TPA: hypothetical protein VMQ65_06130 [Candidatus Limnocylindria bacterium]|nr:hypothetical protein [Candidatus Limnocylindria bacterium]
MPADRTPEPLSAARRREIERWFVRRGVPQFIAGYGTEQSMDARAAPLITSWVVVWTALFWFSRPEAPLPWKVVAIVGSLAFVVFADAFIDTLRGRSARRAPTRFSLVDTATFALLPVLPTLLLGLDPLGFVFSVLNVLLGIGVIYVVIGFGLLDIGGWAIGLLRDQLVHIATLVSRTLPMLLILVVFLMFSAELWEAAHVLHGGELAAVLALLLLVASVLVVSTFRPEVRRLEGSTDWAAVREDARETPLADLADREVPEGYVLPRLTWLQRRNVEFVVLINQLLQSTFVSLLVLGFLLTFGLIVVPATVQATWIGEPVTVLIQLDLLGEARILSAEMLFVCTLLSGIVGLYFTGLALTDPTYRTEHVTAVVGELQMLLAARALYLAALHPESDRAFEGTRRAIGATRGGDSADPT